MFHVVVYINTKLMHYTLADCGCSIYGHEEQKPACVSRARSGVFVWCLCDGLRYLVPESVSSYTVLFVGCEIWCVVRAVCISCDVIACGLCNSCCVVCSMAVCRLCGVCTGGWVVNYNGIYIYRGRRFVNAFYGFSFSRNGLWYSVPLRCWVVCGLFSESMWRIMCVDCLGTSLVYGVWIRVLSAL